MSRSEALWNRLDLGKEEGPALLPLDLITQTNDAVRILLR